MDKVSVEVSSPVSGVVHLAVAEQVPLREGQVIATVSWSLTASAIWRSQNAEPVLAAGGSSNPAVPAVASSSPARRESGPSTTTTSVPERTAASRAWRAAPLQAWAITGAGTTSRRPARWVSAASAQLSLSPRSRAMSARASSTLTQQVACDVGSMAPRRCAPGRRQCPHR